MANKEKPKTPRYANALSDAEADRVRALIDGERAEYDRQQRNARANMKAKQKGRPVLKLIVDATPELIAKVDSEWVNPAEVSPSEQRIGRVRRMIAEPLDRLKRGGHITLRQYDAGDWWRKAHDTAGLVHSGRQGYEPRSGSTDFFAPLPTSERAAMARHSIRVMGAVVGAESRRMLDRLCVYGTFTAQGRAGQAGLALARLALNRLAFALRLP